MHPCRRSASGYRGVRTRPSGRFDVEIRSGEERIRLGTFDMAHEVARAYDAVAWRLGRYRLTMNFHDVWTREQAGELAPPSPAVTREQQRRQRELEQRLLIVERDERLRLEWARQFPEDIAVMEAFYAQKEEQKAAAKQKADREKRRAESAARAKKAARRAEEKKNRRRAVDDRPLLLLRVDVYSSEYGRPLHNVPVRPIAVREQASS
nr:uncharacterized protein LOC127316036 [Lolium perenne]